MKDFHLRFFMENRWPSDGLRNDLAGKEFDSLSIPETSGAYIFGTNDGTMFKYPWGSSPIFYIGQSKNLNSRFFEHRKLIIKAERDHEGAYWWPRYQYGASFGTDLAWYTVRGTQNPNKLEADLMNNFYNMYGSIPVANGAWPSGLRKPQNGKRDD